MRKIIFYSLLVALFFSSCSKDHKNNNPAVKTYKVNLNVTGFTQQIVGSTGNKLQTNAVKADALTGIGGYLDQLYYVVFNSANGQMIHLLKQDSTMSNFGNIVDELPSGTYGISIAAGKPKLTLTTTGSIGLSNNYFLYYSDAGATQWGDTFFDQFTLTVSGSNVTQNVTLNRIVGQLEVKFLDNLPSTADSVLVSINPEDFQFIFPQQTVYNSHAITFKTKIPASAIGKANYTVDNIVFNTYTPFTATITCTDASQKVLGIATISNVTCQKNTRTILSGNLFSGGTGVTVGLSPWNPPITATFSNSGKTNPTN